MQHKELDLEKRCRQYAREHGWIAAKLEKNGLKGIPDDLFMSSSGAFLLIEFKRDKHQRPRPEQQLWLDKFPNLCHLIGDYDDFVKLIEPLS